MDNLEINELEQLIKEIKNSNLQIDTKDTLEFLVRYMNNYFNDTPKGKLQ